MEYEANDKNRASNFLASEISTRKRSSDTISLAGNEEIISNLQTGSRYSRLRRYIPSVTKSILIVLALYGYIQLCYKLASTIFPSPNTFDIGDLSSIPDGCDCGANIAEAKTKGCIYDGLAAAWLPTHCRDDELTAEFNKSGPLEGGAWPYWADEKRTIPLTTTDLAAMGDTMDYWYSTHEWHVMHCNFTWRKRFRMKETGIRMEKSDSIGHIRHCGEVFLDRLALDAVGVYAQVGMGG